MKSEKQFWKKFDKNLLKINDGARKNLNESHANAILKALKQKIS